MASTDISSPMMRRGATCRSFSGRRHRALCVKRRSEEESPHLCALRCSRAFVKSRSLSPDDPFGERSSWEDPSDGIYAAWKDVDQEAFVNAAGSQEVRQAHFGPEWARLSTVGRMSVKKMREDQKVRHAPPPGVADEEAEGAEVTVAASASLTQRYPTAEELHESDLRQRRRLLKRSYSSYEAFVEHELGGGEGSLEAEDGLASAEEMGLHRDFKAELHSAASMEDAFSAVVGLDGRDRMAQRSVERAALEALEAAEVAERVPLPPFMLAPDTGNTAVAPTLALASLTLAPTTSGPMTPEMSASKAAIYTRFGTSCSTTGDASESALTYASATASGIPAQVVRQVLGSLGAPHGDLRLPLSDPMRWGTEDIVLFLTIMERPPLCARVGNVPESSACSTMDDTMCDAFRMARVTGETLLNVVVPPRLFRLMRQWHLRRQDVVLKAWKLRGDMMGAPARATDSRLPDDVVQRAVAEGCEGLAEAVEQLDSTLIQETILLCFRYGH
ncbi:hypothetical protein LSCM1_02738 [Leishmania martiniquensis]|uniref:Uncharacterized protein n=1 Tax=Leishmania martiniquensis TaxID=1580590 RepID=A0A836GPQ4_9TRYP|nr:hypothetical protein LSCM1_02738 [Leishmania martiniquensis]